MEVLVCYMPIITVNGKDYEYKPKQFDKLDDALSALDDSEILKIINRHLDMVAKFEKYREVNASRQK